MGRQRVMGRLLNIKSVVVEQGEVMNKGHKEQVEDLVEETIRGAILEDFNYSSQKEADDVCAYLKKRVAKLRPFEYEEEED